MRHLLFIFGTRPEFLKLYPIIEEAKQHNFNITTCYTNQQKDLTEDIFKHYNFSPDIQLSEITKNHSLNLLFSTILSDLNELKFSSQPSIAIVQGDTTSAAAGALWAFNSKIPVAHIEAGLRSYDLSSPYPEEGNRKLISAVSTLHFCPTETDRTALKDENITQHVHIVGNPIIDMLHKTLESHHEKATPCTLLVTCHRRENFGKPFENICSALMQLCEKHPDITIHFIQHPNPHIYNTAPKLLAHPNISLLPPKNYPEMIAKINASHIVLTDSGGLQEEAPSLNKPVLILRNKTERHEGIQNNNAMLVGTTTDSIIKHVESLLISESKYSQMARKKNPYGDGKSSAKIINEIKSFVLT